MRPLLLCNGESMIQEIIQILKQEDKPLSVSEISALAQEGGELRKSSQAQITTGLKRLFSQKCVAVISTVSGNKYYLLSENFDTNKPVASKPTNPRVKEIDFQIVILVVLVAAIIAAFVFFIKGLNHPNFAYCGVPLIIFLVLNIVAGLLVGNLWKFSKGVNDWTDYNAAPGGITGAVNGLGAAGFGMFLSFFVYLFYMVAGWVFATIRIVKLILERARLVKKDDRF